MRSPRDAEAVGDTFLCESPDDVIRDIGLRTHDVLQPSIPMDGRRWILFRGTSGYVACLGCSRRENSFLWLRDCFQRATNSESSISFAFCKRRTNWVNDGFRHLGPFPPQWQEMDVPSLGNGFLTLGQATFLPSQRVSVEPRQDRLPTGSRQPGRRSQWASRRHHHAPTRRSWIGFRKRCAACRCNEARVFCSNSRRGVK